MVKLKGRMLLFDTVNKNRDIFPKTCKLNIPEKVPLLWEFCHSEVIGIAEVTKDELGLLVTAFLFPDDFIDVNIQEIFSDRKIGVGGFYNNIKKHEDKNLIVVDEATLREVSITLAPVCDEYTIEMEEKEKYI